MSPRPVAFPPSAHDRGDDTKESRCSPGRARPTPSAPRTTARGPTSRCSARWRPRSPSACSTPTAPSTASRCPSVTASSGTATCPAWCPASATATASRARSPPSTGQRCNAHKLLIDPYAKAVDGSLGTTYAWDESLFGYHFDDADEVNHDDSAQHVPKAVVVNPYFDWHDDRPPRTPYHETVVYEAHVKGLTNLHPEIPEEMRGTYSAVAHPATVSHLQRLGITAIELMPVHQFVHDDVLVQRGLRNYWGYNTIAFFAPALRLRDRRVRRRLPAAGRAGAGVQGDGAGPARGRHRGDPRRRLQPHRRGQPPGPDAVHARHRQPGVLPPRRGPAAVLHGLHRHRELAQRPPAPHAAADHGLAALLGHRDARRRLPLRPRLDARPRVLRRRPAVHLLRPGPAGPGDLAGQADRRAVGRRPRRLPGRQLPARVDRVERQVPRHGA